MSAKKFPLHPPHPETTCWGCDKYCPAQAMVCGNGSDRTQHPAELFGPDWHTWQAPMESLETPAIAPLSPSDPQARLPDAAVSDT